MLTDRSVNDWVGRGMLDLLFTDIGNWLGGMGPLAYIVAPLVMACVAVLPIPAELPAMINGMLFGPWVGSLITWSGAMLGAWISFEIAHAWGRPMAERVVHPATLEKVDTMANDGGWWGLIVLRLIPVIAFTALNWGAGLCCVPRGRFLWTTAVGIAPGAVLFTSSGVGLSALYARSPLAAGGLVVLVLVTGTFWAYSRRRRAEAS